VLLKTDGSINELCLQWVSHIPRTTAQGVPALAWNMSRGRIAGGESYLYAYTGGKYIYK